jgi:hypothetical protein
MPAVSEVITIEQRSKVIMIEQEQETKEEKEKDE